ncbi:transposase for insertion sequence element IS231F [Bacillus toyonensis]|nr:transposase for insertion sequence element IS231F [Bacillus toyonensis]
MDQRSTYYISRLKLNTNVYVKNPNPEYFKNGAIKKQSEYIQIDVKQILKQLQPGEGCFCPSPRKGGIIQNIPIRCRIEYCKLSLYSVT